MPNTQLFPQSTFPIAGDVTSTPGNPFVVTTGIQNTGVVATKPTDGQVYVYVAEVDKWVPADPVVSGPNTVGTASTAPPVQVGGIDEGNLVRELRIDTYGGIRAPRIEEKLDILVLEIRALKAAVINLDKTANDQDFVADQFQSEVV